MEARRESSVKASRGRRLQSSILKDGWAVHRRGGGGVIVSTQGEQHLQKHRGMKQPRAVEELLDQKEVGIG